MAKNNYDIAFNEELLGKELFEYKKSVRPLYRYLIYNTSILDAIHYVIKYLLFNVKLTPYVTKDVISKYIRIIVYAEAVKKMGDEYRVQVVDNLLNEPLTVEKLLSVSVTENHLLGKFINFNIKELGTDNNLFDTILHMTKIKAKNFVLLEDNYFTPNIDLTYYLNNSNYTKLDLIIADTLTEEKFEIFDFYIPEEEMNNFKANLILNSSKTTVKRNIVYMGYIVNEIFKEQSIYVTIKPTKMKVINLDKEFKPCLMFLDPVPIESNNFINENSKMINFDIAIPFKFIYNGKIYTFDESLLDEVLMI